MCTNPCLEFKPVGPNLLKCNWEGKVGIKEIFAVFRFRLQSLSAMFWIGFEQSPTMAMKKCSERSSYDNDTAVSTSTTRVDLQKGGNDQKRRGRLKVSTGSRVIPAPSSPEHFCAVFFTAALPYWLFKCDFYFVTETYTLSHRCR